jgi:predicted RNase H-like HicB family nuclease
MKRMKVEGFEIEVKEDKGVFIVSVPELPGCTTQVDKEEEIVPRIKGVIGDYLIELASLKPILRKPERAKPLKKGDEGEPGGKIKKK